VFEFGVQLGECVLHSERTSDAFNSLGQRNNSELRLTEPPPPLSAPAPHSHVDQSSTTVPPPPPSPSSPPVRALLPLPSCCAAAADFFTSTTLTARGANARPTAWCTSFRRQPPCSTELHAVESEYALERPNQPRCTREV